MNILYIIICLAIVNVIMAIALLLVIKTQREIRHELFTMRTSLNSTSMDIRMIFRALAEGSKTCACSTIRGDEEK